LPAPQRSSSAPRRRSPSFVRAIGCTGALTARLRPFAAHPDAMLSVAGYRLVARDGSEIRTAPPPLPPFHAHSLLRPSVEASAVLVRSEALDQTALDLNAPAVN